MTDTLSPFRKPYGSSFHILPGRSWIRSFAPYAKLIFAALAGFAVALLLVEAR